MKILLEIDISDVVETDLKILRMIIREALLSRFRPMELRIKTVGRTTWWPAPKSSKYLLDSKNDVYHTEAGASFDGSPGILVKY